jgi:hypothetical protein
VHLVQLRQAVNSLCDAAGAPAQFTPAEVMLSSLQGQIVQDEFFTDLMTRINNIRTMIGAPPAGFSDTPVAGGLIRVLHLQSLRNALE